jgi:asparagine synthase (glutamine-hydrolysing)
VKQAEQQPVSWCNRFWLWGDLRLDGREELHEQLDDPHDLPGTDPSSEELLLRAWAKWGPGCLQRVIGDFSFALWDAQEQTLWCARDLIGPRPFYYGRANGLFCFSNTLEVLRWVPELSRDLDEIFLGDFMLNGWQLDDWRTVHRDILRLPAGHVLRYGCGNVDVRRFHKLPIEDPLRLKHPEAYLDAYRSLLKNAVGDRLPAGAASLYLSGGLDSTSVCAVAAQIAQTEAAKNQLRAFTLSWKPFCDDLEPDLAQLTAQHLGIKHEVILPEAQLHPFESAGGKHGIPPEPNDEVFFVSERRTFQRIASHANVVLSGDGGDEVLTGQSWPYLKYLCRAGQWTQIVQEFGGYLWRQKRLPPLRGGFRVGVRALLGKRDPYEGYPEWLNADFARRTALKQRWIEFHAQSEKPEHPTHPIAYEALHSGYWATVLETEDAGWNRVRLESRAPLLDLRLLSFLLRLPPVPWCMHKHLCREAMKTILPDGILNRPKTPLLMDPLHNRVANADWITDLPKQVPGQIEAFVNWSKWCETLSLPKGSLTLASLRPASLFYFLKAVESN